MIFLDLKLIFIIIIANKIITIHAIGAVILVIIGTILATKLLNNQKSVDWYGIFWGMLSAMSFTTTMFTANRVATNISAAQRSLYMLLGGSIIVFGFSIWTQTTPFKN